MSEHNFSMEDFNKYREESEKAANDALLDVKRYPRSEPNPRKRKQEPTISWPREIKLEVPDEEPDDEEMCCLAQLDGTRCPLEHCHIPLGELLLDFAERNDCPLILHPMSNHYNICVFHWKQIKYSRCGRLYEDLVPMTKMEEIELMADLDKILEEKPFRRRDEEESDSSDSEESSSSSDEEKEGSEISDIDEFSSESEFDEDEETESETESESDEDIWKRLDIDVRDRTLMNGLKVLCMTENARQRKKSDSEDDLLNGWEVEEDKPADLESDEASSGSEDSEDEDTSSSSSSDESSDGEEEPMLVNGINSPELPSSPAEIPTEGLEDDETSNDNEGQEPRVASLSMITRHRIRLQLLNGDRYHEEEEEEEEQAYQENGLSVDDTDEDEEKENHDPLEEEDEENQDSDESSDSEDEDSSDESSEDSESSDDESSESSDDDLDTEEEKDEKDEETNDPEAFGPTPIHEQLDHMEIEQENKDESDEDLEPLDDEDPRYEMWQDEKETSSESEDSDESDDEEIGQVDVNEPVDNPEEVALILQGMSTLPVTTLRRYRKFHGIPTRATATKVSMLPMITRHFSTFDVDPNSISASFLTKRKKRHNVHRRPFRR